MARFTIIQNKLSLCGPKKKIRVLFIEIIFFINKGGKMKNSKKHEYRFWRWLILSIVRIPKLYILVWGIMFLAALAVIKIDLPQLLCGVLP